MLVYLVLFLRGAPVEYRQPPGKGLSSKPQWRLATGTAACVFFHSLCRSCYHTGNSPMWEDGGLKSPPVVLDWPCGPVPRGVIRSTLRCAPVQSVLDSTYLLLFPIFGCLAAIEQFGASAPCITPIAGRFKPRTSGLPTSPSQPVSPCSCRPCSLIPRVPLTTQHHDPTKHLFPLDDVTDNVYPNEPTNILLHSSSSGFSVG